MQRNKYTIFKDEAYFWKKIEKKQHIKLYIYLF